jgi:hypothetical protein
MRKATIAFLLIGVTLVTIMLFIRSNTVGAYAEPTAPPEASSSIAPAMKTPQKTAAAVASPTPEPTPFSFAWIADTQQYTAKDNDVFSTMTKWIADTQGEYNTVLTMHTGDIVYNPYAPYQWENSVRAFAQLPKGMRILTAAGNHDFLERGDPNTPYLDNRPDTDFDGERAFDEQGYDYYTVFTAGGVQFLVFSLAYGHELAAFDWINEVCSRYSDHFAVLCLHTYVDEGAYSSVGIRLFDQVVKRSPNIRLVVCGHARGAAYWPEELDDNGDGKPDRTVHQMMFDTQDDMENGVGFLRILRFHPKEDTIEVVTYSPVLDRFGYSCIGGDGFQGTEFLENAGLNGYPATDSTKND